MNRFTKSFLFVVLALIIFGCSRKKNNFVSRNWHAVTTEYNTLYNGGLALDQGREELIQNYEDNYWDILPVERMQIDDQIILPDSVRNENFGIAEEKAVKAIQRHSMLIGGKEKNPQIDDAYLLLGKARYFDQRFLPALEAFNFILHRYPASNNINHAQVWREKTNLRLGNDKIAIKNLKKILEVEQLDDQDLADANATMAQAYINLKYLDSAVAPLNIAAEHTRRNEEKGRYLFIKGQIFNILNEPVKANTAFDEVIALNRRSPRVYMINAEVQKARNFNYSGNDHHKLREHLTKLEEERENRPYLDKIYFQIGEHYNRLDSTDVAVEYYNRSLRSPSSDKYLQSINYEILANINFDRNNYRVASKFFDSTLATMSTQVREYRSIKKKRENLDDVIFYENIAEKNDSIIHLINLPEEEKIAYFRGYTESLKVIATAEAVAGNIELNEPRVAPEGEEGVGSGNRGSSFYFYNTSRTSTGLQQFRQKWGDRELADNWRWERTGRRERTSAEVEEAISMKFDNDPRFDPMTYVNEIPTEKEVVDSILKERNMAYYQLGLIYKEKFGEHDLASEKLEALLENSPEERLILPAKYHLYRIYEKTGDLKKVAAVKQDILKNHPNSRYAAVIEDPGSLGNDETGPEVRYSQLYRKFENQKFVEVIEESERNIEMFTGDEIVPKFELLKAMAIGRIVGFEAYKKALNDVALNYPQTEEGKKAQDIYNRAIPQMENKDFKEDNSGAGFKLFYRFSDADKEDALALQEKIEGALKDLRYEDDLKISVDTYTAGEVFVVVHGLRNESLALGFAELLAENKDYKISYEPIVISSNNYKIVQIHKNLESYAQNFN